MADPKLRITNEVLYNEIKHLSESIEKHDGRISNVERRSSENEGEIKAIYVQMSNLHNVINEFRTDMKSEFSEVKSVTHALHKRYDEDRDARYQVQIDDTREQSEAFTNLNTIQKIVFGAVGLILLSFLSVLISQWIAG